MSNDAAGATPPGHHIGERRRVDAAMRRVLERRRWPFSRRYPVSIEPGGRVDFWVAPDDSGGGCAVLTVDGTDAGVEGLSVTITALDRSGLTYEALVVVVADHIEVRHAAAIRSLVRHEPLGVTETFEEDFASAMAATLERLSRSGPRRHPYADLPDRIERIDRQQVHTQDMIARVAGALEDLRSELQTQAIGGRTVSPRGVVLRTPPQVRVLFDEAFRDLDEIGSTASAVDTVYAISGTGRQDHLIALRQIRSRPDEPLRGLGAVALIKAVVVGLQDAVEGWFSSAPPPGRGFAMAPDQARRLEMVCSRYDEAYEWLPTRELVGLRRLPRLLNSQSWDVSIGATQVLLARLGSAVRDTAFSLFTS